MYQAPEVFHLEKAVKAIKQNLLPQKNTEPDSEDEKESGKDESEQATEET